MVRFVNCTGFPAVMWGRDEDEEYESPKMVFDADPEYTISLQKQYEIIGYTNGFPIKTYIVTDIKGLPDPEEDTVFIVSQAILDYINQYTTRTDFVCLADKVNKRFDKDGNVLHGNVSEGTEFTVKQVGYRAICLGNAEDIGEEQIYDTVKSLYEYDDSTEDVDNA